MDAIAASSADDAHSPTGPMQQPIRNICVVTVAGMVSATDRRSTRRSISSDAVSILRCDVAVVPARAGRRGAGGVVGAQRMMTGTAIAGRNQGGDRRMHRTRH